MNFFIKFEDTFQVKFIENSWEELVKQIHIYMFYFHDLKNDKNYL